MIRSWGDSWFIRWVDPCFFKRALHKKWSFPWRISSVNMTKSAVTFTEETLNGKIHLLWSAIWMNSATNIFLWVFCFTTIWNNIEAARDIKCCQKQLERKFCWFQKVGSNFTTVASKSQMVNSCIKNVEK